MRSRIIALSKGSIPLFAGKPSHPFVPLGDQTAGARSEGQGRPRAGASRAPLTAASTLAGWRHSGDRIASGCATLLLAGVLSLCVGPAMTVAQSTPVERPAVADPHAAHIAEASRRFGIPEHWIRAVLRTESAGDVRAVSSAGAMGLMQVMPDTWAELRARYRLGGDPYDPRDNILAGAAYLREMFDRYGNVGAMLAAYNAGPGRYDEYLATGRTLPSETRAYVAALAPVLSGELAPEVRTAVAPPPPDWRDAPLFVRVASAADPVAETQSSGEIAAANPRSDSSVAASIAGVPTRQLSPAGTPFVARSGAARPQ